MQTLRTRETSPSRRPSRHLNSVATGVGTLLLASALFGACGSGNPGPQSRSNGSLLSQGKRLFDQGIGTNGAPVPRESSAGGTMGGGMMPMMNSGCASCHGADGHGTSTARFDAPDITHHNLTDPAGMIEPDGSHGHRYTDTLIRRAITTGIGADGDQLDAWMPRWQLTRHDWQALLRYLETLQ